MRGGRASLGHALGHLQAANARRFGRADAHLVAIQGAGGGQDRLVALGVFFPDIGGRDRLLASDPVALQALRDALIPVWFPGALPLDVSPGGKGGAAPGPGKQPLPSDAPPWGGKLPPRTP